MSEKRISRRSLPEQPTGNTDWERLRLQSDEDIRRAVDVDPDAAPLLDEAWFRNAELLPPKKQAISIRLDRDVLDYFRQSGKQYQTRINAVLRAYVEAQRKKSG